VEEYVPFCVPVRTVPALGSQVVTLTLDGQHYIVTGGNPIVENMRLFAHAIPLDLVRAQS
jgi:hypothetical protein